MRILVAIAVIAAALWGGYWFVGATAVERALAAWIAERRSDGWVADYATLDTRGFPNRFDTTLTDLDIADPATGWAWTAPFFQILALSYRPTHVIAVWPEAQSLATPLERIDIASDTLRASVVFEADTALTLDRATLVAEAVRLRSNAGWNAALAEARLATRQTAARPLAHDLGFEARDLVLAEALRDGLDPTGLLPGTVARLAVDATVAFDAPWDRFAVERARPQPTAIDLRLAEAQWGDLALKLAGSLEVDAEGRPEGEIVVKATNWRDMIAIAVASGALPEGMAGTLEGGLGLLAGLSGDPKTLDVPLRFADGRVSLGPIPLGPAPILRLR
ncbi:DUF2125 domain-containing protein [Rhodobacteraceae bacterium CCMM004]|nr:DUF2125 domain-containing protein [Rhodobacteraceae bacterium CCMM004]